MPRRKRRGEQEALPEEEAPGMTGEEIAQVEETEEGIEIRDTSGAVTSIRKGKTTRELTMQLVSAVSEAYAYAKMLPENDDYIATLKENIMARITDAVGIVEELERIRTYWENRRKQRQGQRQYQGQGNRYYQGGRGWSRRRG